MRRALVVLLFVPVMAWGQGAPAAKPEPPKPELSEVEHLRLLVEQLQADRNRLEIVWARDRGLLAKAQAELRRLQDAAKKP
jgi:hypothetical protein